MSDDTIYLDWAATTPLRPEVVEVMSELAPVFANPSSVHTPGRAAREHVETARGIVAAALGADPQEILFTSGASESCNLALKGLVYEHLRHPKVSGKPHVVTSAFEHHAVLEPLEWMEKMGFAEATFVRPDTEGIVHPEAIAEALQPNTILVSLMWVNNEIGTIQPLAEVAEVLAAVNKGREVPILFHTDATQGIPYLSATVPDLKADMLSMSGHKLGGPKGVGVLYKAKRARLQPIVHGGSHERGLRAGTENFLSIAGLARALEITVAERDAERRRLTDLRRWLEETTMADIPGSDINGHRELRSPHISNLYFADIEAEALLTALDLSGIAASSGSACTSEELGPSHVLMSICDDQHRADGSLRLSFGWETTRDHLDKALDVLRIYVPKLRAIAGRV
jgi:cysteine desulfurase